MEDARKIQRVVGYLCALVFMAIAYASMAPEYELTWPVIAGVVIVIALLLGKAEAIAGIIEAWKNK